MFTLHAEQQGQYHVYIACCMERSISRLHRMTAHINTAGIGNCFISISLLH